MTKYTDLTLENYLIELSSDTSVPGGGSVSAYVASLALGLTQMVGRISLKRKKKKDMTPQEETADTKRRETISQIIEAIEKAKRDAFQIVNLDPQVYQEVMKVWGDEAKLEDALENSFRMQAELALLAVMGKEWNKHMADHVSGSIKNDLIVSAGLVEAAFKGAYHTALINLKYMKNQERRKRAEDALEEAKKRFDQGESYGG